MLSKKRYKSDNDSKLSPIDLALGWQEMSKDSILKRLKISQHSRFYQWRYEGKIPTARVNIETQSANMHMIPLNNKIKNKLLKANKNDIVEIEGYLVRVRGPGNYYWNSSTTRSDTGKGACEVVLVKNIKINNH